MERRTYLHKKYLFNKGFALFILIFLTGSFSLTAHAEEETDTAGSSLGKEVYDAEYYCSHAQLQSQSTAIGHRNQAVIPPKDQSPHFIETITHGKWWG